jgi:acyl carrier protein
MGTINNIHIEKEIKNLLVNEFAVERNKITGDMSFVKDLGMDSFKSVELIYELELKYNIKIPNEDIKKLKTITNVVNYISKKLSSKRKD